MPQTLYPGDSRREGKGRLWSRGSSRGEKQALLVRILSRGSKGANAARLAAPLKRNLCAKVVGCFYLQKLGGLSRQFVSIFGGLASQSIFSDYQQQETREVIRNADASELANQNLQV